MGSHGKYIDPSLALTSLALVRSGLRMTLLKELVAMKNIIWTSLR